VIRDEFSSWLWAGSSAGTTDQWPFQINGLGIIRLLTWQFRTSRESAKSQGGEEPSSSRAGLREYGKMADYRHCTTRRIKNKE
jgi:hypothetical protein